MNQIIKRLAPALATLMVFWLPLRACGAETDSAQKKPAVVVVRLPAQAELVIGGVKSKQRTAVREFDTPPLAPGKKFSYSVKAVWKDGDKEVTRETTILVKAGETTEVDLLELKLSPPHAEKIPAPELVPAMDPQPASLPEPETKPESKLEPEKRPEPEKKPEPKPEMSAPKGTLSLLMPETLNLQPGGTKLLPIKVVRTHCEGPVSVIFEGLPPGVELKSATVAAGKQKVYAQATAPADAEEKEWEVKVIGISGSVRQESTLKIKIAK